MKTVAVVLNEPEHLVLRGVDLTPPTETDVVVDIEWSGISTGTERLLWTGRMPPFPGMGYPLVPGYESVGRVTQVAEGSTLKIGQTVFVPGARCFGDVRGLFGGAASRLVVPGSALVPIAPELGEQGRPARARRDRVPCARRARSREARSHRRPWRARPSAGAA